MFREQFRAEWEGWVRSYCVCCACCIRQSSSEFLKPVRFIDIVPYQSEHQKCLFHFLRAAVDDAK